MLSSRDKIKTIAAKGFFRDIEGKTFEEDHGEENHEEQNPKLTQEFVKQKGLLDAKEEEEGFDEVVEVIEEDGSNLDLEEDIQLMISQSSESEAEGAGEQDEVSSVIQQPGFFETDSKHLMMSDELEEHLSSQEFVAMNEDNEMNGSVNVSLPKIKISEVSTQQELDDLCMGMFHVFASHLGWSVIPMHSQVQQDRLILNVKQIREIKRQVSTSSTDLEPPMIENLSKVNLGRSSETCNERGKERLREFVEKLTAGQIRFAKKKKNGFIALTLETPGVTLDLIQRALEAYPEDKDVIDMILRESNMLTLVKTLCTYP
ncbi:phosphoprotein [Keuraliba virus]|uniref:Phosphoprotein n=1 Tax=Keuraliba virus TaxID=380440 RepID=A0A0D3R1H5_9RHAB|nr:phosphoprotein [Keuraliba virus]AJR28569.1 phosphoprotein [Keuraliba virus]